MDKLRLPGTNSNCREGFTFCGTLKIHILLGGDMFYEPKRAKKSEIQSETYMMRLGISQSVGQQNSYRWNCARFLKRLKIVEY